MRKVIGIGETILDIIFQNNQPSMAVPGGSVFNSMISLGRLGVDVSFISETGNDRVGNTILDFMRNNNLPTVYMSVFPDGRSPISLAYLDQNHDADYLFYKDYPAQRLDVTFPKINEDDIVVFGSYFALNPVLREKVTELLEEAKEKKAIIYYDVNFRSTHKDEAIRLAPTIIENLEYASLVRGSKEDFINMYKIDDVDRIYKEKISFYCPNFIRTSGAGSISLRAKSVTKEYPVEAVETVSTIGSGDNFNAGLVYALLKNNIRYADIDRLSESQWDAIVQCGIAFSAEVCRTFHNSVSWEFAKEYIEQNNTES